MEINFLKKMIPKNKNIKTLFETDSNTNKTVPVLTKPLHELEHWKLKLEEETLRNKTGKIYFIK